MLENSVSALPNRFNQKYTISYPVWYAKGRLFNALNAKFNTAESPFNFRHSHRNTLKYGIEYYIKPSAHGQLPNVNPKIHSQRSYVHQNVEMMCRRISIPRTFTCKSNICMKYLRESHLCIAVSDLNMNSSGFSHSRCTRTLKFMIRKTPNKKGFCTHVLSLIQLILCSDYESHLTCLVCSNFKGFQSIQFVSWM